MQSEREKKRKPHKNCHVKSVRATVEKSNESRTRIFVWKRSIEPIGEEGAEKEVNWS